MILIVLIIFQICFILFYPSQVVVWQAKAWFITFLAWLENVSKYIITMSFNRVYPSILKFLL